MEQKPQAWLDDRTTKRIILIAAAIILMAVCAVKFGKILVLIKTLWGIVFPFVLGACIAFIFNVPMRQIERKIIKKDFKGKRAVSYLITLVLILGIIAGALGVVIPQLWKSLVSLANDLKALGTAENFEAVKTFIIDKVPAAKTYLDGFTVDYSLLSSKLLEWVQNSSALLSSGGDILNSVTGAVGSFASGFLTFLIGFAFSIYVLVKKETLARQARQVVYGLFKQKTADRILEIGNLTQTTFSNFIRGQCLEAFILGCMFLVTMSIVGLPYAFLCSILIGITALIPIFGAFVGCGISVLLIATVSLKKVIIFGIVFIVLQQLEGKLIYPHVVGSSVGLPSVWVLFSITVGGDLMGVAGMLIGVPTASVLYALFREFILKRLKKKDVDHDLYDIPYEVRHAEELAEKTTGKTKEERAAEAAEAAAKKAARKAKVEELKAKRK